MKKLAPILVLSISTLFCSAQTNTPPSWFSSLADNLGSLTNVGVAPYLTYAPSAPTKFGGGVLALYNFNSYAGAGIGIDWLGGFSQVSANLQLRYPIRPLSAVGLTNFWLTPVVIGAVTKPMGASTSGYGTITGFGFNLDVARVNIGPVSDVNIGIGYVDAKWDVAGPYNGTRHEVFVKLSKGF